MLNKSHHWPSPSTKLSLTIVGLATASVALTSCGSDSAQATDSSVIEVQAPPSQDQAQYGASIEEWTKATGPETQSADDAISEPEPQVANDYPEGYELLDWEDLLPAGYASDEIFARYQDQLAELEDGSPEAEAIYDEMQAEYDANSDVVNQELDGAKVNLAGFVAPLNYDDEIITEYLLVPYYGACIHVPAPPPNQTVLVKVDKENGLSFEEAWGPIWVAGTIVVEPATTDLATASYAITDATSGVYSEQG